MYSGLRLFKTAFQNTKRQIFVSGVFLVAITCVLNVALFLAESCVDSNFSFWDAFIWPYEKYLGDPGKIVDEPLQSTIGQIIGTLVGIMGVAIFAVPAGLIGSGLTDAMDEEKCEKELEDYRRRLQKAFRRSANVSLREYLNSLPDMGGEQMKTLNFVPKNVSVAKLQVRQGMDQKDIMDTCRKFPEFRLKNMADAQNNDDTQQDRFVVEHFPLNSSYGCYVPRQSKVTIVCASSFDEVGIGWFTYYLAKLGGFNYISKEVDVDTDELDSFYNLSEKPLYDKKTIDDYPDTKENKEARKILEKKLKHRNEFISHLKEATQGDGTWTIIFTEHIKNSANQTDFHLADTIKDGTQSTVNQQETYRQFCDAFAELMKNAFDLETVAPSSRYPLLKKNLGYTIRKENPHANVFVLRPSSEILNFDNRIMVIAYRMAQLISEQLDGGKGITDDDVKDLSTTDFGYKEKKGNK